MKKILYLAIIVVTILGYLVGCDNNNPLSGSENSKITGSIAYFYGEEEAAIESFYSEDKESKQIELSKENTYTIGLRPSFRGSKQAVYNGDCATFSVVDGSCEITYIGEENSQPVYELKIKSNSDFDLTITVGDYSQTIKIIVKTSSASGGDEQILFDYYFDVIATLDISDIKSVKSAKYAGSSSPQYRAPVEHKASALDTDIEAVFTWLKGLENNITPYTGELSDGGSSVCLTVYTSVGTLVLWEDADGYLLMGENYYSQNYGMPMLEGETVTYTFESYYDDAKVYTDGIQIGTADFAFEDIVCERVDAEQHERLLWMDTCIGTIDVYSSQYFGRNGATYKIISGPDFTGIINKFFAPFDESTRVNYEVEHDSHSMGYGNDNHLYPNTYVFYEIEDFKSYCDTEGLTRVRDRISSLDGKTLIVVEFSTGSSADSFDVADVGVNGETLTIRFKEPAVGDGDGMTAAWVHYAIVIVDKDDFSGEASDVRFTFFDDWGLIPPVVYGEKIEFNAKYHNSYNWNENKSYPSVRIIRSFSEFTAYCTEHSIRNDFYDEAYFQDKYLVAIIEEKRYAGGEVLIESVVCHGDKYFVSLVSVKDDYGIATVMGERHCFIELDNSVPISAENNVIVYF